MGLISGIEKSAPPYGIYLPPNVSVARHENPAYHGVGLGKLGPITGKTLSQCTLPNTTVTCIQEIGGVAWSLSKRFYTHSPTKMHFALNTRGIFNPQGKPLTPQGQLRFTQSSLPFCFLLNPCGGYYSNTNFSNLWRENGRWVNKMLMQCFNNAIIANLSSLWF